MSDTQTTILVQPDAISTEKSKYNIFDPLPPDEFANMKATVAQHGVLCPIIMDDQGNVIEGYHRSLACKELGIACPAFVRHFESEAEKMEIAAATNANRRHLSREQKREVITRYLKADQEIADNFLGELLGVSKNTVADVRLELESTCQIDKLTELRGKDGKLRPREMNKKKDKPEAKKPTAKPKPSTKKPAEPVDDHMDEDEDAEPVDDEEIKDADDGEEKQPDLNTYSVVWRRIVEGQVTVTATDPDAAARKVRRQAEKQTALEIQSDCSPSVEINQVEDATGKVLAVSRSGDLGQPTEAASPTPAAIPDRIANGFVVMVKVKDTLGYKTEKHDGNRWLLIAADERAAKLAVDGCVPKPASEHAKAIANMRASTAGACFVTATGDGTLTREFVPWEKV